jgi:hypothetical protein
MISKVVIIKRGGKPITCPICKKRDGKHYQVNEKEFRCCNCATKFEIEKVQE